MAPQRLIDRDSRTRKRPMRVLVLGMCRTGTTSISSALRKLGYTPHQMREVLMKSSELVLWQEAINVTLLSPQDRPAKQRNQPPYTRPDFDKLLSDYDAVMDLPGCIFAKELIEAYPDAKIILTKRRYEDWEQSMQESIWCLDTWKLFRLCRILNITQLAPLMRLVYSVFRVHNGNHYGGPIAKSAYEKHYDVVRSLVSKERLMELDTNVELKWEPICEFLGVGVPKEQYPTMQEEKAMRRNLEAAWRSMVRYVVLMLLLPGLVTFGAIIMYWYSEELRVLRDEWVLGPLKAYIEK